MKILLTIFVLLFSSSVLADDISDFEIEGMSIGDSLLDYFSENLINDNIVNECLKVPNSCYLVEYPEFMSVTFNKLSSFKTYDFLVIYVKPNDRNFKIYSINGIIDFNNIHQCTNKRDEINKKLSEKFREAKKTYHLNEIDFNFKSGRSISIACYDWSKDKNSLLVSLHSKEYVNRKPSEGIDSLHPLEFYMFNINSLK